MKTLGINPFSHDASVALCVDGKIIAAVTQERFDRIKHSTQIPREALEFCLKQGDISDINQLESIGFTFNFLHWKIIWHLLDTLSPILPSQIVTPFLKNKSHLWNIIKIWHLLRKEQNYKGKVIFLEHHLCHAASVYFASPYSDSVIITADGKGEIATTCIYEADQSNIKKKLQINHPDSIGILYSLVTEFLGFKQLCDEGKIMGLAPYGNNSLVDSMKKLIRLEDGFSINMNYFQQDIFSRLSFSEKFYDIFGNKRKKDEELTQHHKNIAFAIQALTEKIILHIVAVSKMRTESSNLSMAGGVILNSVTNGKILESNFYKNVYFYPAAGDDGTAVGAAFLTYYQNNTSKQNIIENSSPYLGPEISESDILAELAKRGIKYTKSENIAHETAKLLAQNKFVGWIQGKAEFGPRALGNRSILADPRNPHNKDRLNATVKFRESFRPFAPSILEEEATKHFKSDGINSPYMIVTYDVVKDKQDKIPAVTHIDKTARIQTVNKQQNERYYNLISEFNKLTGVPVLLNTSFNRMNEPIVNSAEQAVTCFLESGLEVLAMGDYLILKD